MRRGALILLAGLTITLSAAGYLLGAFVGLLVAGIVSGYRWGWAVVMDEPTPAVRAEDED